MSLSVSTAGVALCLMGLISTLFFRSQFLLSLMSLELVTLGLFVGLIIFVAGVEKFYSLAFYMLVLGVCEASMGLSLLVNITRSGGSDILGSSISVNC